MATNQPSNFAFDKMAHFENVSSKIVQTINPIIDQLIARRDALLHRVDELREDYRNIETIRISAFEELETVQLQMQEISIKVNTNIEFHEQVSQAYQQGPSTTFLCPIFRCQKMDTIQHLISELGEIVQCEIPDYSLKKEPVVTTGKKGEGVNEFYPAGIAIDESNELMYIADCGNNRVQVVSFEGFFVKQLGKNMLSYPWGIALTEDCIFITDIGDHSLFQFRKKDFKLNNRVGTEGEEEGQLYIPQGLCIDTNGDVFVADSGNNRVSVFSKQLNFKSCVGTGHLDFPADVKLTADCIVVLDWSPKCVHFFSREGHLLSSCISQGNTENSSVFKPFFFCLDIAGNIIISDYEHHAIGLFTESGHRIHTIGREGEGRGEFIRPYGICVSKLGIIFVLSHNSMYILQCF